MTKANNPFSLDVNQNSKTLKIFREKLKDNAKPFASGNLRVSVLDTCNLNCSYCYNEGIFDVKKKRLSPSDLELILKAVKPYIKSVKLIGGEPLIHPEIVQLMKVSKKYAPTTITTNGILLEKYVGDINKLGIDGMTISLDDTNPKSFRTLIKTNPAIYERIVHGIDALVNSGYDRNKIGINVVVSKQNFPNLQNVIDFASQRNLGKISFLGLIKLDKIKDSDIANLDDVEAWLDIISNKSEYDTTTSRRRYSVNKTNADVVWQYCTVGCDVCRVNGFIRVTPSYDFKYCISDGAGVSFEKELKAKNIRGIKQKFQEAIGLMGKIQNMARSLKESVC